MINHADPNCSLYVVTGKVIQDWGDEVLVAWDYSKPEPKNIQRYFKSELRLSKR